MDYQWDWCIFCNYHIADMKLIKFPSVDKKRLRLNWLKRLYGNARKPKIPAVAKICKSHFGPNCFNDDGTFINGSFPEPQCYDSQMEVWGAELNALEMQQKLGPLNRADDERLDELKKIIHDLYDKHFTETGSAKPGSQTYSSQASSHHSQAQCTPCSTMSSESSQEQELEDYEDEAALDPDYLYSENESSDEESEGTENARNNVVGSRRRFIGDINCLAALEIACSNCKNKIQPNNMEFMEKGTAIILGYKCAVCGAAKRWDSQGKIASTVNPRKQMYAANLDFSVGIPVSGLSHAPVNKLFRTMNLTCLGKSQFFETQALYVEPQVEYVTENERTKFHEELRNRSQPLIVIMDGTYTSPGYTAMRCTYTAIDYMTGKVILSLTESLSDEQSNSSSAMERTMFNRMGETLVELFGDTPGIAIFSTDNHTGIKSDMATNPMFQGIIHESDVWHLVRNVKKAIFKSFNSAPKRRKKLGKWMNPVCTHIQYAAFTASISEYEKYKAACISGDPIPEENFRPMLIKELIMSFLYCCIGKHEWIEDLNFRIIKRCPHMLQCPDLEYNSELDYFSEHEPAYKVLKDEILNAPSFLSNLARVTNNIGTSTVESIHFKYRCYAEKRVEWSRAGLEMRRNIAILDHNENTGRPQKRSEATGKLLYKTRICRGHGPRVTRLQNVLVPKSYKFIDDIVQAVHDMFINEADEDWKARKQVARPPEGYMKSSVEMSEEELLDKHNQREILKLKSHKKWVDIGLPRLTKEWLQKKTVELPAIPEAVEPMNID